MAFPPSVSATKAECDQHILDIRKARGADRDPRDTADLREDLESCLALLSEQLYTTPSHFIHELIQNADDNSYPVDAQPSALLAYRADGFFFFGCNEVGFSKANVEAICRISKSTKVLLKGEDGCIGEKGISFKAVFKVASEVWISSGNYEFKFDKRESLGMVTPHLAAFPKHPAGCRMTTMIALKVDDAEHQQTIREQLLALAADSFMFLRRLKRISIVMIDKDKISESTVAFKETQVGALRLLEARKKTSATGPSISRYLVSDFKVTHMPETALRPKMASSIIRLAFPVSDSFKPQLASRQIYAFLPVCLSGLPFHIQADFLLVASRQGVDESLAWNRRLRDKIVEAVLEAFIALRSMELRFTWVMFLPKPGQCPLNFFKDIASNLIDRARRERMLETCSGVLAAPGTLFTVPSKYCDSDGAPLLLNPACRYVAQQYPADYVSALVPTTLDAKRFVMELDIYINKQPGDFKNKPGEWHSRLCSVLSLDLDDHGIHESLLCHLPLIPLANDRWIQSRRQSNEQRRSHKRADVTAFYLPDAGSDVILPEGLSLFIVDRHAAEDSSRNALYRRLGGKQIDYAIICTELLKLHKSGANLQSFGVSTLLSHAHFLFSRPKHIQVPNLYGALYVTDAMLGIQSSNTVYLDKPGSEEPVSTLLTQKGIAARFLHPSYLEGFNAENSASSEWLEWLTGTLGINTIPRLINKDNTGLSAEFLWIMSNFSSRTWLSRLMSSWKVYHLDQPFSSGNPQQVPSMTVRNQLRAVMVDCTDGSSARLDETVLPTLRDDDAAISTAAGLRFLDLTNEKSHDWLKLSALGVTTSMDLHFHIKILQGLQHKSFIFPAVPGSKETEAGRLYKRIQDGVANMSQALKDTVRNALDAAPLIYIPTSNSGEWRSLKDCVWGAPSCFRELLSLEPIYPTLSPLFKDVLGVQNVTAAYMIERLAGLQGKSSKVRLIKDVLLALSGKVADRRDTRKVGDLNGLKIFPVTDLDGSVKLVSNKDVGWFIPDTPSLKTAFLGRIKLLDFSRTDQDQLGPLLEQLGVRKRVLSSHAKSRQTVVGQEIAERNDVYTMKYRDRAHYLLCLRDALEDTELKAQLEGIEVFAVSSIITRRFIHVGGLKVDGAEEEGSIVIGCGPGLQIYAPDIALQDRAIDVLELGKQVCNKCKFAKDHLPVVQNIFTFSSTVLSIETSLEELNVNFEKRIAVKSSRNSPDQDDGVSTASPISLALTTSSPESTSQTLTTPAVRNQAALPLRRGGRGGLHRAGVLSSTLSGARDGRQSTTDQARLAMREVLDSSPDEDYPTHARSAHALADDAFNNIQVDAPSRSSRPTGISTRGFPGASMPIKPLSGTSGSNGASKLEDAQAIRIGEQGELKMWQLLQSILGAECSLEMWTSHTRGDYTDSPFLEDDSRFADFTILDKNGTFTKWLAARDDQAKSWIALGDAVKYHLEVKSTYGSAGEAFHMSQNQIEMAQKLQCKGGLALSDVYVIMRVSDLAGNDGVAQVYPIVDPWTMVENGTLTSFSPEGYVISFA